MQNYWTETIKNRGKQGFGSSVAIWFAKESLLHLSDDLLKNSSHKVFDLIDFRTTQKHLNKDKKHLHLLQLALWAENHKEYI